MGSRDLVIGYESALDYWRAMRCAETGPGRDETPNGRVYGAQRLTLSERAARAAVECRTDLPLHVVVADAGERPNSSALEGHVYKGPLGSAGLHGLGGGVYVCQPAPMIVQLASGMNVLDLAILICELCGTYGLLQDGNFDSDLQPVTSTAELKAYAAAVKALKVRGAVKALEAMELAADGSASPRESEVAVFFSANRRKGGAGLSGFAMNEKVEVPKELAPLISAKYLKPDYLWEERRLVVEYDSNEHHLSPIEKMRDEKRRRILERMGYKVLSLTAQTLRSDTELTAFVADMELALGIKRRPMTESLLRARGDMRARLFGAEVPLVRQK